MKANPLLNNVYFSYKLFYIFSSIQKLYFSYQFYGSRCVVWLIFHRFLIAAGSSLWKCRNDTYQIHSHSLSSSEEDESLFKVYVTHSVWDLWSVTRTKQDSFENLQCKWSNAKAFTSITCTHKSRSLDCIWHSSIEVRALPIHAGEGKSY